MTVLRALGHSVEPLVALELLERATPETMIALATFEQESGWAVGMADRVAVSDGLQRLVLTDASDPDLRRRALDTLGRWDPPRAADATVSLLENERTPPALLDLAAGRIASSPEHTAAVERALAAGGPREALLAATLSSRVAASTDAGLRGAVLDALCRGVRTETPPEDRRRSVLALGRLADPGALRTLTDTARDDPDPAVRAAAVVALRGQAPESAERLWSELAERDASAAVRDVARHELERSRRASGD